MGKSHSNHRAGGPGACYAASDKGRVREENQDAYLLDEVRGLFIVSDGMGGHAQGATASQIVVESLPLILAEKFKKLKSQGSRSIGRAIYGSIVELNRRVRNDGTKENGHKNMGATVVMALRHSDRLYIANVGDSRAYLFRNNRLRQLTLDHTIVAELVEQGHIKPRQAQNHPQQNVLTQCVGVDAQIKPSIRSLALKTGDRLLLCSDGLTAVLPDEQIKTIFEKQADPESMCNQLIHAANTAGGPDNITVLGVSIV
jgi:serine/threonine protein phosphatase PrpC